MLELRNGAEVVSFASRDGKSGVVLARYKVGEWVVWRYYDADHPSGAVCEFGQYFRPNEEGKARKRFAKRVAEVFGNDQ